MIRGEPLSDRAKGYYRAGLAEGEARGKAEGKAEGEVRGEARALLAVLDARGLAITSVQRDAILACADPERLERWVVRAATAQSVAEVFADSTAG